MYRVNLISQLIYMAVAILLIVWLIPVYCPPWPGYGIPASFFPNVLSWTILILSCFQFVRILIKKTGQSTPNPLTFNKFIRFCGFIGVLSAGWFLISLIGFIIGGIAVLSSLQLLMGEFRPVRILLVSCITVPILYFALTYGLHIVLP